MTTGGQRQRGSDLTKESRDAEDCGGRWKPPSLGQPPCLPQSSQPQGHLDSESGFQSLREHGPVGFSLSNHDSLFQQPENSCERDLHEVRGHRARAPRERPCLSLEDVPPRSMTTSV